MKNTLSYTLGEQLKLSLALSSVGTSESIRTDKNEALKAVRALENELTKKPREWVLWFALSDLQSSLGDYSMSVRAAQVCYKLKPRDPRSAYGLATALRMLTYAIFVGHPGVTSTQRALASSGLYTANYETFDPNRSKEELEKLNLTLDEAAKLTILFFQYSISLGLDSSNESIARQAIALIHSHFPHLQVKPELDSTKLEEEIAKNGNLRQPDLVQSTPQKQKNWWLLVGIIAGTVIILSSLCCGLLVLAYIMFSK
jgi:hypothetical protein